MKGKELSWRNRSTRGDTETRDGDMDVKDEDIQFQLSMMLATEDALREKERLIEVHGDVILEQRPRYIGVDLKKKKLEVLFADLKEMEYHQILDLSEDGDRWEGDLMKEKPYGWGVVYDKDNHKVSEGFRLGEVNICYGTTYYSDIEKKEYEGEWFNGKRCGRGTQYDRNGAVVYKGKWLNDERIDTRVELTRDIKVFHNQVEELVVSDHYCSYVQWKELDLSLMPCLKSFTVGNECFQQVEGLKMIGMSKLESVVIGDSCFSEGRRCHLSSYGEFVLKNCPKLKTLKIGCDSFTPFTGCEIENVDALETIEIGRIGGWETVEIGRMNRDVICFRDASLELKGLIATNESQLDMPSLKSLVFGDKAFLKCHQALFESSFFSSDSLQRLACIRVLSDGCICI